MLSPSPPTAFVRLPVLLRVVSGSALVGGLYLLASGLARVSVPLLGTWLDPGSFAQRNVVLKSILLVLTLGAMHLGRQRLGLRYGFTRGRELAYGAFTKQAVGLALVGLLAAVVLNVGYFALTRHRPVGFPDDGLLARILGVWLWSSLVEEILFRGLFQAWVAALPGPSFRFRQTTLSFPVLLSAGAFAALHLSLLLQGKSAVFVAGIVLNAFLLGLLAAHLREKTGSLYPAIYVHILFNVVGSAPLLLHSLVAQ